MKIKKQGRILAFLLTGVLLGGCGTDPTAGIPYQIWEPLASETETDQTYGADESDEEETGTEETVESVEQSDIEDADRTVTITISAAGDVTLGNHQNQDYGYSFRQKYDEEGDSYFFKNVKDIFEKDDMTIVNFEGVLTFAEERRETTYNMKGDPSYINILKEGSVEAAGFANNHRLDYLKQGSDDTVACFEDAGIVYAYDHVTGIFETKGIKIGLIAVDEVEQGSAVERYIQEGIPSLREQGADLVIVYCHWGIERENTPEDYQKVLGHKCVDWGADLVLGSHPHVLQGIEVYQGRFIVYSLANFCFGGNRSPQDKDTMVFQQQFTFVDGVKQEDTVGRVIPCSVSSVSSLNDFCPTPAEAEECSRILNRIQEYSTPFGTTFDTDGNYVAP